MASQVKFPKEEPIRPPGFEEPESPKDKLLRKLKQEPLVPLGCLLTTGAIIVASHHLRKGNRRSLQTALRWRIYFQGITVVAALGGMYYYGANKTATPTPPIEGGTLGTNGAYGNVATAPGRPPTIAQVNSQQERQEKSKKEWEERLRLAQLKQEEEDKKVEQKRLEAALLRGTGVSLTEEEESKEEKAARRKASYPVIGKDRQEKRGTPTGA